jgi:hypothetical protein
MNPPRGIYLSPIENVDDPEFGFLRSPRRQTLPAKVVQDGRWYAFDNDCFTGRFNESKWMRALEAHRPYQDRCLFVTAPDVFGDVAATMDLFDHYEGIIHGLGYRVALVRQDGLTEEMIPWDRIDALFIGGNYERAMTEVRRLMRRARALGKWIHVGRVNTRRRLLMFNDADSWDGTAINIRQSHQYGIARWAKEARASQRIPGLMEEFE